MSKNCSNCGTLLEDNALFCSECGAKQDVVASDCQPTKQEFSDFEVMRPDKNTITFNVMGIPFNMKFIKGMNGKDYNVQDFYMGETLVTQALWQTVVGSNDCKENDNLQYAYYKINDNKARVFLTRLKKITRTTFHIPTDIQFKYAALKGYEEMSKKEIDETKWGDRELHPVCSLMPNRFGLYDLFERRQIVSCLSPKSYFIRTEDGLEEIKGGDYYARLQSPSSVKIYRRDEDTQRSISLRLVLKFPISSEIELLQNIQKEREKMKKEEEERLRREEEEKKKAEAEKKKAEAKAKLEEEKKKKEEEERLKREEEEKKKAAAEKKKAAAEKKKAEAKAKLEEEKKKKEEEERLKREEEKKKKAEAEKKKAEALNGVANGHHYVDLGLPSGLKWAASNVGASKNDVDGMHVSWGEIKSNRGFSLESYSFHKKAGLIVKKDVLSKYNEKDNKKLLERTDDLAAAMWKGKWRMPTIEEFKELLSKCKSRWTTMDGIKGRLFTGPNGNSIFLPAAGKCEEGHSGFPSGQDKFGAYWSSSLNPSLSDRAQYLYFDSKQVSEGRSFRYRGMSVRPVME